MSVSSSSGHHDGAREKNGVLSADTVQAQFSRKAHAVSCQQFSLPETVARQRNFVEDQMPL
jgi:hypothetical protein